jgi:hypothetical protein
MRYSVPRSLYPEPHGPMSGMRRCSMGAPMMSAGFNAARSNSGLSKALLARQQSDGAERWTSVLG